jgi:hypothetical protein
MPPARVHLTLGGSDALQIAGRGNRRVQATAKSWPGARQNTSRRREPPTSRQALGNALAGVLFLIVAIYDFTQDDSGIGVVFLVFSAVFLGLAFIGPNQKVDARSRISPGQAARTGMRIGEPKRAEKPLLRQSWMEPSAPKSDCSFADGSHPPRAKGRRTPRQGPPPFRSKPQKCRARISRRASSCRTSRNVPPGLLGPRRRFHAGIRSANRNI